VRYSHEKLIKLSAFASFIYYNSLVRVSTPIRFQMSKISNFPRVLRIEPASACNLKCLHCPTGTVDMKRGVMKYDLFEKVLKQVRENIDAIDVVVLYHGGEPLANKNFTKMVSSLKEAGVPFVKTVSNGMLLKENLFDEIIASGLDSIEFSLDGQSPEENNFIRRRSEFAEVVHNVKKFINYKLEHKLDKPSVFLSSTQFATKEQLNDKEMKLDSCPSPQYLEDEFQTELKNKYIEDFKTTYAMRWPHMNIDKEVFGIVKRDGEKLNYCDHVENTMTVRSNGDVVACCFDLTSKLILGNINEESISDIWQGDNYKGLREDIENYNYPSPCSTCNTVKPPIYLYLK